MCLRVLIRHICEIILDITFESIPIFAIYLKVDLKVKGKAFVC